MNATSLAGLLPGERATIRSIEAEEGLFHRLSALGFRSGKHIEMIRHARFGGPLHVRIGTTEIILRKSEADRIKITLSGS